jgi:hypothetical protein
VGLAEGILRLQLPQVRGLREPYRSKLWTALGRTSATDRLTHEYEALRTRDLSGYDIAYLCIDAVYEPLRRWGSKTGMLCVWGICGMGGRSCSHSQPPPVRALRGVWRSCGIWSSVASRHLSRSRRTEHPA